MNAESDDEQHYKRQRTSGRNGKVKVGLPPRPVLRGQLSGGILSEDEEDEVDREENWRKPPAVPRDNGFSQDSKDEDSDDGGPPVVIERSRISSSQAIKKYRSDVSSQSSSLTTSEESGSPPIGKIAGFCTLFC
jgi:hypothetical protein